jgi:hypothetical protein
VKKVGAPVADPASASKVQGTSARADQRTVSCDHIGYEVVYGECKVSSLVEAN